MDSLIEKLCDDLEPVKCRRRPWACSAAWVVFSALLAGLLVWKVGIRNDIVDIMRVPEFLFEIILVALIGASATYCAALLRVPDMCGKKWALAVPLTLSGVFVLWKIIVISLGYLNMPHMEFHHCMGTGLFISSIPALLMFALAARGFTTHPFWMATMNGLGIGSIGYIALRLTCRSEDLGHILYTHLLPFMIIGTLLGFLARRLYKW